MISAFGVEHGISKSAVSTAAEVATKVKKPLSSHGLKAAGGFRRVNTKTTELTSGNASMKSKTNAGSWALKPRRDVTHTEGGKKINHAVTGGGLTTKGKIAVGGGAAGAGGAGIAGYQRYKNRY